jgi:DNA polymerase-3 subunit epsilon
VDNSHRQLHGALLDAQLLAEAYLALTAGQGEIGFDSPAQAAAAATARVVIASDGGSRPRVQVLAEELIAHEARLAQLRKKAGRAIWDMEAAGSETGAVPA